MSPKAGAEEAETEKAAVKAENETESKSAAATKAAAKRRTKTGCLSESPLVYFARIETSH